MSVIRTQRFPWEQVSGFMGERSHDEARMLMVLEDQRQIALPGTLDPEELRIRTVKRARCCRPRTN